MWFFFFFFKVQCRKSNLFLLPFYCLFLAVILKYSEEFQSSAMHLGDTMTADSLAYARLAIDAIDNSYRGYLHMDSIDCYLLLNSVANRQSSTYWEHVFQSKWWIVASLDVINLYDVCCENCIAWLIVVTFFLFFFLFRSRSCHHNHWSHLMETKG